MTADKSTPSGAAADTDRVDATETDRVDAAGRVDADDDPITVLLVDDDADFVALASTLLEAESDRIETTTETHPQDAIETVDLDAVDCIVSDYRIPEMNGIEFLTTVRASHPDLPFILFTGRGDEAVAKQAIAADVSDYIVKNGSAEQYAISANRIENLVDQYRARRRANRKRSLDGLRQAVLETALTEPTRVAIEAGVAERLVDGELYAAAWIAEPDPHGDGLVSRVQAGETDLFETAPFETGEGSIEARALSTGEPRVEADTGLVDRDGEWASAATDHGFAAAIAAPISYEGVPYGVVGVYTGRSALVAEEVSTLETLADLTAFAIGASERRRGDTSRQVVAIEFAVDGSELPFVRIADALGCTVSLTGTTHRNDGTTLTLYQLGETTDTTVETVESVLEAESVDRVDRGDRRELAVVTADSWLPESIGAYGGTVATAAVDADGARLVLELPPSAEVRAVVEAIQSRYPGVEPVARRERTRRAQSVGELRGRLAEVLTDRQREVIETAYRAGYYEWPHEASSEAVADRLGITQPTFAEHFWTAHRHIVRCLFDPDVDDTDDRRRSEP